MAWKCRRFQNDELRSGIEMFRRARRGLLNPLLVSLTGSGNYPINKSKVIAGSPRSGTTWLAEVISAVPGACMLFEPLRLDRVPQAAQTGMRWLPYQPPNAQWKEGQQFFSDVLAGRIFNFWMLSFSSTRSCMLPKMWVIKFVRANLLLGWLTETFPIKAPVMIVRDPCATIASQLAQGWRQLTHPPILREFLQDYPEYTELLKNLKSPLDFLAAKWSLETLVPLVLQPPRQLIVVRFEELRCNGQKELERIYGMWGEDVPCEAIAALSNRSATTRVRSRSDNKVDHARILQIAQSFGVPSDYLRA